MKKNMLGLIMAFIFITFSSCSNDAEIPDEMSETYETPSYVEQEFIDLLKNSLNENNEYEVLKDKVSSKLLTIEELAVIDLDGTLDALISHLEENSRYSSYHQIMLVDADNDGIDDIILYLHSGGSAGFVDLVFYKGAGDGTYTETYSSLFGIYTENAFVQYNGQNYFLLTSVDYNRKVRTGFDLYYFTDGVLVEHVSIQKEPESYVLFEKTIISDEYDALADALSDKAQEIYFNQEIIVGSGEAKLSDEEKQEANEMRKSVQGSTILVISSWYTGDIDNDGIFEIYSKGMFSPSNNSTYIHLTFDCFKGSQEMNIQMNYGLAIWADDKIPQNLWVESVENKNIICVMSTNGFYDMTVNTKDEIMIDCYYIKDNTYQSVINLRFTPEYKIFTEIYTQDINRDFINDGATDIGKG